MKDAFAIAAREIRATFTTPVFYVLSAALTVLAGFFFFSILSQFNTVLQRAALDPELVPSLNDRVVEPYYRLLEAVLIFLVPILSMRTLSDEKRSGTFELLMTSPVSVGDVVWGKYLAQCILLSALLLLTLIFPLVLSVVSDPELSPILVGFLGLLIAGWAFMAIGIGVSCCTTQSVVAGVITLVTLLILHVLDAPADDLGTGVSAVLRYLTPTNHAAEMLRGVLASGDLIYFFSLGALGLFAAARGLDAERWR